MERSIFISAELGVRHSEQVAHAHKCAELYISLDGRTTDVVNGRSSKTLPLDVFVLTRDVVHGQVNTADYRYCIFKFDMDALVAGMGESALDEGFQSIFVIDPALRREGGQGANMQIDPLTAEYAELVARVLMREGCGALADEMLLSLVMLICKSARPRSEEQGGREVAFDAVFFINTRYSEDITLDSLAARSGYSPRHFARLFAEYVGTAPMRYLSEVRLSRAAALLSENKLTVTEIAEQVGFGDSGYFAKSFRARYGVAPLEYRKRSRGN